MEEDGEVAALLFVTEIDVDDDVGTSLFVEYLGLRLLFAFILTMLFE
jgi:hypothetical protein